MKPAPAPGTPSRLRVLVADPKTPTLRVLPARALADLLGRGDLLVVNDAGTLPASVSTRTANGSRIEVRLAEPPDSRLRARAVLFGPGDFRDRTEHRAAPPRLDEGDVLAACGLRFTIASVSALSPRLVEVELSTHASNDPASVWAELYRVARPVQYSHVPRPLELWDVQNVFAAAPWSVEMPSAGRVLDGGTLSLLRSRGIEVARITHAAGLSATGDPAIDARLPLPERFLVTQEAASAVAAARWRGGRVIAVGTSVVRSLETAAREGRGAVVASHGLTDLVLSTDTPRLAVDAVLTGLHEPGTSHFGLLGAFAPAELLERCLATSRAMGLLAHEFGDAWLVYGPRVSSARFAA